MFAERFNASFVYMKLLLPSMIKSASITPSSIPDMPFSGTSAFPPYITTPSRTSVT